MITYQELEDGSLKLDNTTIPTGNTEYARALELVDIGEAEIITYTVPVPTKTEKIAAIRHAIGLHIETVAKSAGDFGFDSVLSAVSYVGGEPKNINVIYGTAIFNYREACWNKARDLLTAWQSGGKEFTPEQAVKKMPLWKDYKPEL
tara:strand:- start:1801 stop:2241 length:441 start_codon:yes stop_codon:yes gene_type:complete